MPTARLVLVTLTALLTLGLVVPAAPAAPPTSGQLSAASALRVDTAPATSWRTRFGTKFLRRVNRRDWDWVASHTMRSERRYVVDRAKFARRAGRLRFVDCYVQGAYVTGPARDVGSCSYVNRDYWTIDFRRRDGAVRVAHLFVED